MLTTLQRRRRLVRRRARPRKTILFVSEGIDYDINDIIRATVGQQRRASMIQSTRCSDSAARRRGPTSASTDRSARADALSATNDRAVESLADDGRPERQPASASSGLQNELRLSQDSLRTLAEETGGFAAVNRNDFATAFDRIVQDNSSYYVLAYYPPDRQARRQVPQDRGEGDAARG